MVLYLLGRIKQKLWTITFLFSWLGIESISFLWNGTLQTVKNNFKIIKFLTLSCYWKRKLKYWLGKQLFLNFDEPTIHKQKHIKVSCSKKKRKGYFLNVSDDIIVTQPLIISFQRMNTTCFGEVSFKRCFIKREYTWIATNKTCSREVGWYRLAYR